MRSFNLRHCLIQREGVEVNPKPEDLPHQSKQPACRQAGIQLSGERHEM